jgi:hypothetical protein
MPPWRAAASTPNGSAPCWPAAHWTVACRSTRSTPSAGRAATPTAAPSAVCTTTPRGTRPASRSWPAGPTSGSPSSASLATAGPRRWTPAACTHSTTTTRSPSPRSARCWTPARRQAGAAVCVRRRLRPDRPGAGLGDASAAILVRLRRRVLLRWQAPQPCPAHRTTQLTRPSSGAVTPTARGYVNPYVIPYALGCPRSWRTCGPRRLRRQAEPDLVATQGGAAGTPQPVRLAVRSVAGRPGGAPLAGLDPFIGGAETARYGCSWAP